MAAALVAMVNRPHIEPPVVTSIFCSVQTCTIQKSIPYLSHIRQRLGGPATEKSRLPRAGRAKMGTLSASPTVLWHPFSCAQGVTEGASHPRQWYPEINAQGR